MVLTRQENGRFLVKSFLLNKFELFQDKLIRIVAGDNLLDLEYTWVNYCKKFTPSPSYYTSQVSR